jgi:hypothetical protein
MQASVFVCFRNELGFIDLVAFNALTSLRLLIPDSGTKLNFPHCAFEALPRSLPPGPPDLRPKSAGTF